MPKINWSTVLTGALGIVAGAGLLKGVQIAMNKVGVTTDV